MRATLRIEWLIVLNLVVLGLGCRTAPITGRRQLLVISEPSEVQMGFDAFQEVVRTERPSANAGAAEMVARVGQRIATVSGRPDYQWEFRLLASREQNAFCLPGGKVAVYEGILPICQNEAGLAVVMSHEIGHALARHGGERMSQRYAIDGLEKAVSYVSQGQWPEQHQAVMKAYGLGTQYGVILPYSRAHESEADHIGLMLMAKAGYDPSEAPRFWQRFGQSHLGQQPPEFMSTHPNDEHRSQSLAALLADAQGLYQASATRYGLGDPIPGFGRSSQTFSAATPPPEFRPASEMSLAQPGHSHK